MTGNLYEINAAIAAAIEKLFDTVNEETGEIDAGTANELEELEAERAEKLDNIGAYIKNLTAEADAIDKEIKALQMRKESKKNKIERLKTYVSESLQMSEINKFETARVVFSFRKSESVNILDESAIPPSFLKTKVETTPDKTAIKAAIKDGVEIKGAELITKQNLQIK